MPRIKIIKVPKKKLKRFDPGGPIMPGTLSTVINGYQQSAIAPQQNLSNSFFTLMNEDIQGNPINQPPPNPYTNPPKLSDAISASGTDNAREAIAKDIGIGKDDRFIGTSPDAMNAKAPDKKRSGITGEQALNVESTIANYVNNYKQQKQANEFQANSRLTDNYSAVNKSPDRGWYTQGAGMYDPSRMGYKGQRATGGLVKAADGMLIKGDEIVNKAFLPDINTDMPNRSAQPAAAPSMEAAPETSEKISLSGDFNNYAEKAQKYISKRNPNTDITGEMLATGAQKAFKATGKVVPVELALAQLTLEGYLEKGTSNKPQRTRNPFNVGNTDDGSVVNYSSLQPGVDKYFDLLAKHYLNVRTPEQLLNNFVNSKGHRYAKGEDYESGLKSIIRNINQTIGQTSQPATQKNTGNTLNNLTGFAGQQGFDVTSTTGGQHNTGSKHYQGKAIDVRTRDKSPEEIAAFMAKAQQQGFRVLDERQRPAGQAVWGGPHLHLEQAKLGGQTNNSNMKIRITGTPDQMAKGGEPTYGGQSNYGLYIGQRDLYKTMAKQPYEDSSNSMGEQKNPDSEFALEAEGGETILRPDGTHMDIVGPRHSEGGVKLTKNQAPEGSFIYSDTKKMKIKDPKILNYFGKSGSKAGGVTPADLAKQYDVNKYRAILKDPVKDKLSKDTAKLMIENYERKLAHLALVQESIKGFPQGIPEIAKGLVPEQGGGQQQSAIGRYGGMFGQGGMPRYQTGGGGCLPGYAYDGEVDDCVKLPEGVQLPSQQTGPPQQVSSPGGTPAPVVMPDQQVGATPIGLGFNFNNAQGEKEGSYNIGVGAKANIQNGKLGNPNYNASFNFPRLFGKDKGLSLTGNYGNGDLKIGANTKFPFLKGTLGVKGAYTQNFNTNDGANQNFMRTAPAVNAPKSNVNAGVEWNGKLGKTNIKISGNYGNPTGGFADGGMSQYQVAGTVQGGFDPADPLGVKKMLTDAMNGTLKPTSKTGTAAAAVQTGAGHNPNASNAGAPAWFKPWVTSKTKAGRTSPTNKTTTFDTQDPNKFYTDYNYWKGLNNGKDFSNPEEFQNFVYDTVSSQDPGAINEMWKDWGTTNRGKQFPKDPRKAFADKFFGARTAKLMSWTKPTTTLPPSTQTTTAPVPVLTTTKPPIIPPPPSLIPPTKNPPGEQPITPGWTNIDKRNYLNAGADYASLKKYHPYATNVQPVLPEFVPVDWRGQAAAFQSATNAAANQLGAYLPGQSMASNLSSLAGQQAENLGKAISGVDQYNAAGASNMDLQRANMLNQASLYNAQNADKMAAEENVFDDRFRTAERLGRKGLLKTRNQGEENAAKLYNTNITESPYYTIDPATQTLRFNSDAAKAQWEAETKGGGSDQDAGKIARLKKIMDNPTISAMSPENREFYVNNLMGWDTPPAKQKKVQIDPVTKGNKTETTTYDENGNPKEKFGGSIGASFVKSMGDWYNKLNYIADPVQRQRTAEAYAHKMHFGR
jgi:hypothetical protein